ncbi:hypothetical protein NNJEOMEG_01508 [Fundidesulfovibrio magnetotacticus]|uniref:Uncharacterized protein n=1 Tax=Fundidesulfovibrio magnetotacticus TaxID=2730080 RepID=A0A6V8LPM4_9BACT|nr:hypothetical protein [Fundidesulfovibrio magnetotacticus]GFK93674.1 hypothetical protein NNJEOMEG_01508 [Fundidesulfovibrio magnetotacticus]
MPFLPSQHAPDRLGIAPAARLTAGRLLALAAAVSLALVHYKVDSDGLLRYRWLLTLLDEGRSTGMIYSSLMPLASAPFLLLDRFLGLDGALFTRFNLGLFLAGLAFLHRRLCRPLGEEAALNMVLLLLCGSMFTNLVNNYFGEVFTAVLVCAGLVLVHQGSPLAGWALAVLGAANTPAVLAGLGLSALHAAWLRRDWRHLLAPAGAALLMAAEVWLRNGGLATGYEGNAGIKTFMPYSGLPGFSYPFALGLLSILFSFGKGLLFFVPGLFFRPRPVRGFDPAPLWTAMVLFVAGEALVYAKWWAWYGGLCWGPRFFLFACFPAALALGTALAAPGASGGGSADPTPWRTAMTALATAFSVWVALSGVVFGDRAVQSICWFNNYAFEVLCWYAPEYSTLFTPFVFKLDPLPYGWWLIALFGATGLYLLAPLVRDATPRVVRALRETLAGARRGGPDGAGDGS